MTCAEMDGCFNGRADAGQAWKAHQPTFGRALG